MVFDWRVVNFVAVIGTAFAINILFNVPIWGGVVLAGLSTLLLLGLQRYGVSGTHHPCFLL